MSQTSNFLQSNQFLLVIPSFEMTRFLSTTFEIPSISLPSAQADSPFSKMKFAGDKIDFAALQFDFIIDEKMTNYFEIYNWLMGISYTESFEKFKSYPKKNNYQPLGEQDIKIVVLDSKNNPISNFTFHNAIPVSLSGIPMTSTVNDIEHVRASVVFDYDYFTVDLETPSGYST